MRVDASGSGPALEPHHLHLKHADTVMDDVSAIALMVAFR